jgi:uncharacterized repeat protein (TIGR01451 family)
MPTKPPGTPTLDLTGEDSFGIIETAVFMTGHIQPAGSGNNAFNAFVQLQHTGTEQGYNTDASAQYDEKNSHQHNHSVLLADVPIVFGDGTNGTQEGLAYREFLLDLNETNGGLKPYISLDKLQIWQEEAGNLTNFTPGAGFAGAHTNYLAYDLDAGADRWIGLNAGMAHGSGESDYRILIPDSFFINDAAHRYVTLYSAFGVQPGWEASGGFEEWGLHGASGGAKSALVVDKVASVPGDTADTAGEVISYNIAVGNVGNTALTGITVSDPSVSDLAPVLSAGFNVGDLDHDNALDAGETWQYTASHAVSQDEIDQNGTNGDGQISNTVTADSAETTPVTDTAAVTLVRNAAVDLEKTADVTSVDAAGDTINYTITVTNTGNATLDGPVVNDSQVNVVTPILNPDAPILGPELLVEVRDGDYNVGDTNQNGVEDDGETFQYRNVGDENNNGVEDDGETFGYTNVGDTNQNGFQDDGETFEYYNAGDTNQNGVEDDGETFQYDVSHAATPVDADENGLNDGDTNGDGRLSVGETWQYTVTYTVTQDDIDNGGVVDPGLTHDNTATVTTQQGTNDEDTVSIDIEQNPHLTLVKAADVSSVDAAGDVINYTIDVTNDGNMTLTGLDVTDPSVENLMAVLVSGYNAGDDDQDGKLDLTETWQYTAKHTVTQDDIDNGGVVDPGLTYTNTATATTDQDASDDDTVSVDIEQNPHVTLDKTATVPGDTADANETIEYTIAVTNDGNMTLTNPVVTDTFASNLHGLDANEDTFNDGDLNSDGQINVGETWQYVANHVVTEAEAGAGGSINNTASVTTDEGATDDDSASVPVTFTPVVDLDFIKAALGYHDNNNNNVADAGDVIDYSFTLTNNGNVSLHNVGVSDVDSQVMVFGSTIAALAPGVTDTSWTATYVINAEEDVPNGYKNNDAVATSDEISVPFSLHTVLSELMEI